MFNQEHRSSDLESVSSETSDITSRATTIPGSWSATTLQQKLNQLNQYNIHPLDDDDQSSVSTDTTVHTVTNNNHDVQNTNIQQSNVGTTQNHQQSTWVNPYWGPNPQSGTTVTHQSNTNIRK